MNTIGFIGLGAMGGRIATRLIESGYQVYGTNRTREKAQPLIERGMTWTDTPRAAAAAADIVFSMVTDDHALQAIADGTDGVLAGLGAGKVYVDMSTVSPRTSRALSARVARLGAHMLDAPVSGSIPQAESGTLTIMVGGPQHAFAVVEPLLRQLGQSVTHVGANGQGLLMKLAINISLAVQTLAFSEGLLLAERGGINPQVAVDVMGSSSIGSPMLKARIPLLLHLPDHAWFDIELMHKDIRLARQTASELRTPTPSAAVAGQILAKAAQLGYGHRDLAALHEVLGRAPLTAAGTHADQLDIVAAANDDLGHHRGGKQAVLDDPRRGGQTRSESSRVVDPAEVIGDHAPVGAERHSAKAHRRHAG
jgi:3-hydroxyisobutyrate dehydrogenase-like beta-hydroxyacid dehydrogenase